MADYTTIEEIRGDLVDSGLYTSDDYDVVLQNMLTAASRMIDREVGRWDNFFYPSTVDETRYFDGSGDKEQVIDPMVSLTSVYVSESGGRQADDYTEWVLDTDFYVWPYNYSSIGVPIQRLIVDNDEGNKGNFYSVRKGVKVTGVFGYSATPPAIIEQATKITTLRWFMRSKQGYQDASANQAIGQVYYVRELDPDVKRMLAPYKIEMMVI